MAKKQTEKLNDACIKLFEFIKMLYQDEAEFDKVIYLLSDGKYDGTSNTHVTLNKYLNALKIFGLKVKKINHKYKLQSSLSKMNFSIEDIKSILILKNAKNILPKSSQKFLLEQFIKNVEIRYDEDSISKKDILENEGINYNFYYEDFTEQIKKMESYCQQNRKLEIIYTDDNNNTLNLICTPVETFFIKKKFYIKVIGYNGSRIYEIPVENIKSINQLPTSGNSAVMPTTIVFRIKNRLAKNYKMRPWESLEKIEENGNLIIINKNEDLQFLLKRLMRYGVECEIISPKFFKEEMINQINKTLSNYQ